MTGPNDAAQGDPRRIVLIEFAQFIPRPVRPDELARLRAIWWNLAALGHRLPAETDVIVIKGGAS